MPNVALAFEHSIPHDTNISILWEPVKGHICDTWDTPTAVASRPGESPASGILSFQSHFMEQANMFEDQLPPQQGAVISPVFTIVFYRSKKPCTSLPTCNLWDKSTYPKGFGDPLLPMVLYDLDFSTTTMVEKLLFLTYAYICCIQMHSNGDLIMAENLQK